MIKQMLRHNTNSDRLKLIEMEMKAFQDLFSNPGAQNIGYDHTLMDGSTVKRLASRPVTATVLSNIASMIPKWMAYSKIKNEKNKYMAAVKEEYIKQLQAADAKAKKDEEEKAEKMQWEHAKERANQKYKYDKLNLGEKMFKDKAFLKYVFDTAKSIPHQKDRDDYLKNRDKLDVEHKNPWFGKPYNVTKVKKGYIRLPNDEIVASPEK